MKMRVPTSLKIALTITAFTFLSAVPAFALESAPATAITLKTPQQTSSTTSATPVYWIVSKKSGENMYTTDTNEVKVLCNQRNTWVNKGILWYAPKSGDAVFRLCNKRTSDHHYTTSKNEVKVLTKVKKTWTLDQRGKAMWYSGGTVRAYRIYSDARARAGKPGTHRFVMSLAEVNQLKKQGWSLDDVKMYGIGTKAQAPAKGAAFTPSLSQVSANRPITMSGYLDTQGLGYDTFTKNDGYNFAHGSDGNSDYRLVHFTMDANGKIVQKKAVKYPAATVGHANDATVFQYGGKKYLYVAISGGKEKTAKSSDGKSIKLGVIKLDEYNKNVAKVYDCAIRALPSVHLSESIANSAFSGVTYVGKKAVNGTKRDVFVLKAGRTFYAAYATISGNSFTLTIFNSARINKPTISYGGKTYDASTQGVTYHNGYLYLSYGGEANKLIWNNFLIGRIAYSKLFGGSYNDLHNLQLSARRIVGAQGQSLSKHIPESIFFRTLDGSDNFYLSINRGTTAKSASDIDCVLRSKEKY